MSDNYTPIFDGHNDSLTRLHRLNNGDLSKFLDRNDDGHLDLPRAIEAGLEGGIFAIHAPDRLNDRPDDPEPAEDDGQAYRFDLPPEVDYQKALKYTDEVISGLERLLQEASGRIVLARDASALKASVDRKILAIVLHIEGAEPIAPDLSNLDDLYNRGVRSIGILWSRPNRFGHGVPFAYPESPDTGPGLTDEGKDLVKALNQKGMLLDLSHLNEKGFFEAADLSNAPLVASHSNAWALSPSTRNLTDDQLKAIAESGGLVGVNFCVGFVRPDGRPNTDTPLSMIVDHIDYIAYKVGVEHVAFGSDFDGATIPQALGDVTRYPKILTLLRERGFSEKDVRKIAWDNWLRVLKATWRDDA